MKKKVQLMPGNTQDNKKLMQTIICQEMDSFLERCSLPRLIKDEIENNYRSVTSTEIETLVKKLPTNKSP